MSFPAALLVVWLPLALKTSNTQPNIIPASPFFAQKISGGLGAANVFEAPEAIHARE